MINPDYPEETLANFQMHLWGRYPVTDAVRQSFTGTDDEFELAFPPDTKCTFHDSTPFDARHPEFALNKEAKAKQQVIMKKQTSTFDAASVSQAQRQHVYSTALVKYNEQNLNRHIGTHFQLSTIKYVYAEDGTTEKVGLIVLQGDEGSPCPSNVQHKSNNGYFNIIQNEDGVSYRANYYCCGCRQFTPMTKEKVSDTIARELTFTTVPRSTDGQTLAEDVMDTRVQVPSITEDNEDSEYDEKNDDDKRERAPIPRIIPFIDYIHHVDSNKEELVDEGKISQRKIDRGDYEEWSFKSLQPPSPNFLSPREITTFPAGRIPATE